MGFCRKTPRASLDVFLNKYIEGIPYLCRSTDISEEGMYMGSLIEPGTDEGRVIGLQFQLPGSPDVIYAEGEVVRRQNSRRANGMAVRFTHLATRHKKLIARFVKTNIAA
jgi:hypothetical protein